MGLTEIDYPNIEERFNARINDYEKRIATLELSLQKFYTRDSFIFPTVAARDAATRPPYGTRVFVQSNRTEYLWDGQPAGGPITLGGPYNLSNIRCLDAAGVDLTGDMEIVMRVSLDNWQMQNQCLLSKDDPAGTRTYTLYVNGAGFLVLEVWPMGASTCGAAFSGAGTTYWIKVTYDVNNGAGGHDVKFYYQNDQATEPVSWNQLGSTITTAGTTATNTNAKDLWIGARPSGAGDIWTAGKFYNVILRNGIGGSIAAQMDSADLIEGSSTFASHARTWYLTNLGPGWVVMEEPEQTYVPTLVNVTLGTATMVNFGRFQRSDGFLTINTVFQLGTGGVLTGQPTISLPSGITSGICPRGSLLSSVNDSGTYYEGFCETTVAGGSVITPYVAVANQTYLTEGNILAAVPMTWAAVDILRTYGRLPMLTRYL